jgi:hypothetical protein
MRRLLRPLLVLLAIIFLIEAWLWRHLEPIVEWLVARIPLRALKAQVAGFVRKLPPAATLLIFLIPVVVAFPIKLLGFWLLAQGQWISASAVLALTKLAGMGVTAFIFEVTRPKLLQLAWFRWLYERVVAGLDWARQLVAPMKRRIAKLVRVLRSKSSGRALRLFWRIRSRMRSTRGGLA